MPTTVVYDANVLYPNTLRDLLIRAAQAGLVSAKWTNQILDEMVESLGRSQPDIKLDTIVRLRRLMNAAVRDCLVEGFEELVEQIDLPDKDDRHVLAAAIAYSASMIVTGNVRDFPAVATAHRRRSGHPRRLRTRSH